MIESRRQQVHQLQVALGSLGTDHREHPHVGPLVRPEPMPLPDRLPRTEMIRQVTPRRPGPEAPDDPFQRQPVIVPGPPLMPTGRQQRLHQRPQLIRDLARTQQPPASRTNPRSFSGHALGQPLQLVRHSATPPLRHAATRPGRRAPVEGVEQFGIVRSHLGARPSEHHPSERHPAVRHPAEGHLPPFTERVLRVTENYRCWFSTGCFSGWVLSVPAGILFTWDTTWVMRLLRGRLLKRRVLSG